MRPRLTVHVNQVTRYGRVQVLELVCTDHGYLRDYYTAGDALAGRRRHLATDRRRRRRLRKLAARR